MQSAQRVSPDSSEMDAKYFFGVSSQSFPMDGGFRIMVIGYEQSLVPITMWRFKLGQHCPFSLICCWSHSLWVSWVRGIQSSAFWDTVLTYKAPCQEVQASLLWRRGLCPAGHPHQQGRDMQGGSAAWCWHIHSRHHWRGPVLLFRHGARISAHMLAFTLMHACVCERVLCVWQAHKSDLCACECACTTSSICSVLVRSKCISMLIIKQVSKQAVYLGTQTVQQIS